MKSNMMESLTAVVEIEIQKQGRRKRAPRTENGPLFPHQVFLNAQMQAKEEYLKFQISLKKSMLFNTSDEDQERSHKKRKPDHDFSHKKPEPRPSNGIVIPRYDTDGTGNGKSLSSETAKMQKKRELIHDISYEKSVPGPFNWNVIREPRYDANGTESGKSPNLETAKMEKRELIHDFSHQKSVPRPSNWNVIREPRYGANGTGSGKSPNLETAKIERKRELILDSSHQNSEPRPSNWNVMREPRYDANGTGSGKWPNSKTAKIEKKREPDHDFSQRKSEPMPSKEIVIREPTSDVDGSGSGKSSSSKTAKSEKKRKWKKEDSYGSAKPEVTPMSEEVGMKIEQKAREGGEVNVNIVLVIQKVIQTSDINPQQNRITMPLAQIENTFLTDEEDEYLQQKSGSRTNHMAVPIIEPSGKVPALNLRRWNVGTNSVSYVLNGGWKDVVARNRLREGQTVQLWAFRVRGELNFAFVLPRRQQCSSSGASIDSDHDQNASCSIGRGSDLVSTSQQSTAEDDGKKSTS